MRTENGEGFPYENEVFRFSEPQDLDKLDEISPKSAARDGTNLVHKVEHSSTTSRDESVHHPLVLVPGSKVTFNEQDQR